MKKALVVGSGAREHALAWALAREGVEVHGAPGNPGIAALGTCHAVSATDLAGQVALAQELGVGLVVVGPEAPLVDGLVDALADAGLVAFGPSKVAAQLEGSKAFSKDLMQEAGVPTADYQVFTEADAAAEFVRTQNRPYVVKADGLAAGKGVVVAQGVEETLAAIEQIMRDRAFGEAGATVVLEEILRGQEVSFHAICDGERYVALTPAQDHKRAYDGDEGPNTGGMGAYSPPPVVDAALEQAIREQVVEPTLRTMKARGTPFRGALFVGLMVEDGVPKVLEFNVRFGDPETEVLMARWGGSAWALLHGSARGDLRGVETTWAAPAALCVVLASGGYPGAYEKGKPITGVAEADALEGVTVFQAGTAMEGETLVSAGGRVLCVTATGADVDEAAARAYAAVDRIEFPGKMLRRDIGHHARS